MEYKDLKTKLLEDPVVKAEYDRLSPELRALIATVANTDSQTKGGRE